MRAALVSALAVAALSSTSSAQMFAPPAMVSPPPQAPREEHWYGWKILASDAAAWTVWFATDAWIASNHRNDPGPPESDLNGGTQINNADVLPILIGLGSLGWLTFGTPLIHFTEHNARGAATSVALRLGLPLGAALVGALIDGPASEDDPHATMGLVGGSIAASTIDILFVANVERRGPLVWPTVTARTSGLQLGIAGAF